MMKKIKKFFDFLISPRLHTLSQNELNHQYNKHRGMKYLFTIGSFITFLISINAMFAMLITFQDLATTEIKFYTGLTVFTVFILAGLLISSEMKLESTMKYIIRNQIDIISMIKEKQDHCKKQHEQKKLHMNAYEILEE